MIRPGVARPCGPPIIRYYNIMDGELLLRKENKAYIHIQSVTDRHCRVCRVDGFLEDQDARTYEDGSLFINALTFNAAADLSLAILRLPVLYKQRDLIFTLSNFLLRIPISILESIVWTLMTYFTIGYTQKAGRCADTHHLFLSVR